MTWNLTVSYYGVNSLLLRVKRFYLVHIIVRQILGLSISNCFVNLSLLLITNSIRYFWLLISICPLLIGLTIVSRGTSTNCGLTKYVFPQRLWLRFHQDNFDQIKLDKCGNAVKTLCVQFSELKIQAVFTRKTKGLSRLHDQKFTPSYTTSRDGITCLSW